jgi:hypothetical protein
MDHHWWLTNHYNRKPGYHYMGQLKPGFHTGYHQQWKWNLQGYDQTANMFD